MISVYETPLSADPSNALAAVELASSQAEQAVAQCSLDSPDCIADAFEAYAAALRELAPRLPPQLRALPNIVAKAAKDIRASKSVVDAVKVVKAAIVEVHKRIALLKADNSFFAAGRNARRNLGCADASIRGRQTGGGRGFVGRTALVAAPSGAARMRAKPLSR